MTHYCQADPQWADRLLRNKSMAKVGCLVCAFAMQVANNMATPDATPDGLDKWLDDNKGYARLSNAMNWDVAMVWGRKFGLMRKTMTKVPVNAALMKATPLTEPTILEVRTPRRTTHFVLLIDAAKGAILDPGTAHNGGHATLADKGYTPVTLRILS